MAFTFSNPVFPILGAALILAGLMSIPPVGSAVSVLGALSSVLAGAALIIRYAMEKSRKPKKPDAL